MKNVILLNVSRKELALIRFALDELLAKESKNGMVPDCKELLKKLPSEFLSG